MSSNESQNREWILKHGFENSRPGAEGGREVENEITGTPPF